MYYTSPRTAYTVGYLPIPLYLICIEQVYPNLHWATQAQWALTSAQVCLVPALLGVTLHSPFVLRWVVPHMSKTIMNSKTVPIYPYGHDDFKVVLTQAMMAYP